jgi:hypothetical protein
MRWTISILPLIACTLLFAANTGSSANRPDQQHRQNQFAGPAKTEARFASFPSGNNTVMRLVYSLEDINIILQENKVTQFLLGSSQQGQKINAYLFPVQVINEPWWSLVFMVRNYLLLK